MSSTTALKHKDEADAIAAKIAEGDLAGALARVKTLLERDATYAEAWRLKGTIHQRMNDAANAVASFNHALKVRPDFAEACLNLAETLEASGKTDLAIKSYEYWLKIAQSGQKLALQASDAVVNALGSWFDKGNAAYERGDFDQAIGCFQKALELYPDAPGPLLNLGMALYHDSRPMEAEKPLLHAIRVKAHYYEALNALGNCYSARRQLLKAIAAYRQSAAAKPDYTQAWVNLGKTYFLLKLFPESIAAYQKTLELDPDHHDAMAELMHMLRFLCRWEEAERIRERMRERVMKDGCAEPFMVVAHLPDMQLQNARRWARRFYPSAKPYNPAIPLPAQARNDGKLRIGYLSSDLQQHATAFLISEMFELHDRERFAVYAYSYGKDDNGPERRRVAGAVDAFRDIIELDDRAAAELIRQDGIDILVDLKGYTQGTRIGIAGYRPAPLAMHYLGYPGSTGMISIDYFITDPVSSPAGAESQFTEALIRLPHTYQINDRKRPLATAALPRHTYHLPEQGFVFCDFNNAYKITPDMFAAWMRLLKAVDGSVLWLQQTRPEVAANLHQEAKKHGIDPARLVMAPPIAVNQHLMRYRYVDLFLDTFPVCGHTTASDALWCGVPVVTMAGEQFITRVAASLLHAVGLPELVANTLEEYEALALALARDKERLAGLKKHLENGRMTFPLFDTVATTRAIEAAYRHAAELHRQGKPPASFYLTADLTVS